MNRHAGLVAMRIDGRWRGALIEGSSGAGKSDLALRVIEQGARLVADDRTVVFVSRGMLFGRAAAPLEGLIEARGVGVVASPSLPMARIVLKVRCVASLRDVERLPFAPRELLLGVPLAVIDLWPFEASAPTKLILGLRHLGVDP